MGKEHLHYIRFSTEDFIAGIIGTQDFAYRFAELIVATDDAILNSHTRNAENTTLTSAKEFATTLSVPAIKYIGYFEVPQE